MTIFCTNHCHASVLFSSSYPLLDPAESSFNQKYVYNYLTASYLKFQEHGASILLHTDKAVLSNPHYTLFAPALSE